MLQQKSYAKEEARSLIQSCFKDLAAHLDHRFVPVTDEPELEIAEQKNAWAEATQGQSDALHFYPPDHPVSGTARALIIKGGRAWVEVSPGSQQDILSGVGRAFAEAERLFLFRLTDAPTSYEPLACGVRLLASLRLPLGKD